MPCDNRGNENPKSDDKFTPDDSDRTQQSDNDNTNSLTATDYPNIQNSTLTKRERTQDISRLLSQQHGEIHATMSSAAASSTTSQEAHQPNLPQTITGAEDGKQQTQYARLPQTNNNGLDLNNITSVTKYIEYKTQDHHTTIIRPSNTSKQQTLQMTRAPPFTSITHHSQPDSNAAPQQQTNGASSSTTDANGTTTNTNSNEGDGDDADFRSAIVLSLDQDELELSPYQCLVRKQIEVFEQPKSNLPDAEIIQGRNRPIVAGQVGIRCRHCGTYPPPIRTKGAILFPSTLLGVYQTAQNMAHTHLIETCRLIPVQIRQELFRVRSKEQGKKTCKSSYGGGRQYWADSIRVLGVVETSEKRLRFSSSAGQKAIQSAVSKP